jgi:hypothetical protein
MGVSNFAQRTKGSGMKTIVTTDDFEKYFVKPKDGRTLIVGSHVYATRTDRRLKYASAVGVDMIAGPGVDEVLNLEETLPSHLGEFTHIDCVSVLEHAQRPWLIAENLERLLVQAGTLFLQVPFVWRVHAYPSDFWRFTVECIKLLFPQIQWTSLQFVPPKVDSQTFNGVPYFRRTQVCGFGVRK